MYMEARDQGLQNVLVVLMLGPNLSMSQTQAPGFPTPLDCQEILLQCGDAT